MWALFSNAWENCVDFLIQFHSTQFSSVKNLLFIVSLYMKNLYHRCAILYMSIKLKTTRPRAYVASSLEALVV